MDQIWSRNVEVDADQIWTEQSPSYDPHLHNASPWSKFDPINLSILRVQIWSAFTSRFFILGPSLVCVNLRIAKSNLIRSYLALLLLNSILDCVNLSIVSPKLVGVNLSVVSLDLISIYLTLLPPGPDLIRIHSIASLNLGDINLRLLLLVVGPGLVSVNLSIVNPNLIRIYFTLFLSPDLVA
jgi:hypothetical protein